MKRPFGLGGAKEILVSTEPGIISKLSLHKKVRFHTYFMESLSTNGQMDNSGQICFKAEELTYSLKLSRIKPPLSPLRKWAVQVVLTLRPQHSCWLLVAVALC